MNMKKFMALLLAVVMCVSAVITIFTVPVFADEPEDAETNDSTENADGDDTEAGDGEENTDMDQKGDSNLSLDYKKVIYYDIETKLETMELVYSDYGYDLYYHKETGEVAIVNQTTGQFLSTNPYDVATTGNKETEKEELLSQIIVNYVDNDKEVSMNSYASAAQLSQIKMSKIRGGIRVEYTIGKSSSKRTVPFLIEKDRFEELILKPIQESGDSVYEKFLSYYVLKDPDSPSVSQVEKNSMYQQIPATRTLGALYQLESTVADVERELKMFENAIEQYTEYDYDDVLYDHERTGYEGSTKIPAVFRMALEYYITEDGLEVRLPASGIRYDSSLYSLTSIDVLPYFGAYNQSQNGYVFLPDGSGTLVRFEDTDSSVSTTITSSLYGDDYSFYTQSIVPNMQAWLLPIYGMVENTEVVTEEMVVGDDGNVTKVEHTETKSQGFFAIVTEGDSMMSLSTESGGLLNKYFSTHIIANPRPSDTYPLDGISVSNTTATWTVEADKKYTGSYRIKYFMLWEDEATYVNMAKVYREYLVKNGALSNLESDSDNIELFLETFGSIETTERRFGVPVDVKKDLTSFENAKKMIDELGGYGITSLSIKYAGWANGGLDATAPTKVKVEKVLGGKDGLIDLVNYAKEKNVTIYPDFDFTYVSNYSMTDNFSVKKDTAKTVDDRSSVHRTYDPVYQAFLNDGKLIISPNSILGFWKEIKEDFAGLGTGAISLATLGSELNSDHNDDDSLNRENSKERIEELLDEVKSDGYEILVDKGNAYTLQYADVILNVPLDSSNRYVASESVPFYGMVLHGYKEFAGEAINLAGDYTYNILKTIENGASPYFILSYQNANALKTSEDFSKYYSIRYDIWKEDLVETYQILDLVLSQVKNSKIDNHEFITSRRVLVTYDNGVTFDIDYSSDVITVKNDIKEYTIDFETDTVTENGKEYSVSDYLVRAGYVPYSENN